MFAFFLRCLFKRGAGKKLLTSWRKSGRIQRRTPRFGLASFWCILPEPHRESLGATGKRDLAWRGRPRTKRVSS